MILSLIGLFISAFIVGFLTSFQIENGWYGAGVFWIVANTVVFVLNSVILIVRG